MPVVWRRSLFPDGQFVLTGSADTTARLLGCAQWREIRRFEGHTKRAMDRGVFAERAVVPDGEQVVKNSNQSIACQLHEGVSSLI